MKGKLILVLLCALVVVTGAWAGGEAEASGAESREVTIGTYDNWYTPASYADELAIFDAIQEDTGITIVWDVLPPSQYWNAMQTRMAAGAQDLPDIIAIPGDVVRWGTDGIVVPLEDLIEEHAPNTKAYYQANPEIKALVTAPDGHIYHYASVVMGSSYVNPWAFTVRTDWLEKYGLSEPETTDDWYEVLKTFKTEDANDNGRDDEIPMIPWNQWSEILRWGNAWGLSLVYGGGFSADDDGNVQYDFITSKAKDCITWISKLYQEGLLDSELMSFNNDMHFAKVSQNRVGSTLTFISNIAQYENNLKAAGFPEARYKGMPPAKGPYGDQIMNAYGPVSGRFGITAACDNPEVAIELIDYVFASDEGSDYVMFGIEGKSYTVENGEKVLTDYVMNNPDGMGTFDALRALGAWPNIPYIQTEEAYMALFEPFPRLLETAAACKPYIQFGFPPILPTPDESEELSAIMTDLNTYRDETIGSFILGQQPIDDVWPSFVNTLKDLGIDRVVEIRQAQYDRYMKALE